MITALSRLLRKGISRYTASMSNDLPHNVCRLCLGHDSRLYSLQDLGLTRMIWECTSLDVAQNDNLPQSICKTCFASVEFSHQFRKQCLKSDEILRNCVTSNTSILSSLIEDSVKEEDSTKDVKLEDGFSNNSVIKEEDHIIKPEIEDDISNNSGIDDHFDGSEFVETEQKAKVVKSVQREKKSSVKKSPIKRKLKQKLTKKDRETKVVKKKEKKLPNLRNPRQNVIKRTTKLKDLSLKRFQCDFCGKTFKKKQHFRNHIRIHTGEKPYACEICPKKFTCKHHLQTHSRTHTRERPYACVYCGNRFIDHSAKYRHEKIHTNDRKHPCPHCSKRFMTKYDLNKHVVRHTGGKFHECTVCFQSYADASSLNNHKKIHIDDVKEPPTKIRL